MGLRNKFRPYINNYLLIIYFVQENMLVFLWDITTESIASNNIGYELGAKIYRQKKKKKR